MVIATVNQSNPLDPTFRTTQQGYPAGLTTPANFNPIAANITYIPRNFKTPYVQSWFFCVQRKLPLEIGARCSLRRQSFGGDAVIGDYNQAAPQPTATSNLSLQARRPIQGFGADHVVQSGRFLQLQRACR